MMLETKSDRKTSLEYKAKGFYSDTLAQYRIEFELVSHSRTTFHSLWQLSSGT
jgi:hypothetical protein